MSRALILGAVAVVLFAAGCGGSGGKELSRTAYTQSTESVCTDLDKKGSALTAPTTLGDLVTFARSSAALLGEALEKLRALEAPSDLAETHARWLDALAEVRAKLEDLARAAEARDEATVNRLARELDDAQGRADDAVRDLDLDACRDTEGEVGDPARVAAVVEAAGCEITTVTAESQALHIRARNEVVRYRTYPPTSGKHHPVPAIWGKYSQAVDPRQAVHNLEHGGIVIWFGSQLSDADRNALSDFYDESPNAMLVTPIDDRSRFARYPAHEPLTTQIALTAWTARVDPSNSTPPVRGQGVLAICPHFDRNAFVAFRDEFRGKGPERFPVDRLTPGS